MSRRYTPTGQATRKEQWPCLLCGHPHWEPKFIDAPIVLQLFEFAGKGGTHKVKGSEVLLSEVTDLGNWGPDAKLAIARLAQLLGLMLERETIREVRVEADKKRIEQLEAELRKLAAKAKEHKSAGRRKGKSRAGRARRDGLYTAPAGRARQGHHTRVSAQPTARVARVQRGEHRVDVLPRYVGTFIPTTTAPPKPVGQVVQGESRKDTL